MIKFEGALIWNPLRDALTSWIVDKNNSHMNVHCPKALDAPTGLHIHVPIYRIVYIVFLFLYDFAINIYPYLSL